MRPRKCWQHHHIACDRAGKLPSANNAYSRVHRLSIILTILGGLGCFSWFNGVSMDRNAFCFSFAR